MFGSVLLVGLATPALAGDNQMIANAVSAAPEAVGKDATVVQVNEQGKMRTLREGTNNFTCLPNDPGTPANDPMCLDEAGLEWAKAWMHNTKPPKDKIGFGYMLQGGGSRSNVDPHSTQQATGGRFLKEPPHVMIFNHSPEMPGYPDPGKNPDTSQPWVMWSGTPYEHLMIPVQ
ncbi:hypothetical protein YTPLAS18_31830 [Nitrospira sp.]|nr:hypothetical protein YTPLAS18_31830 [Nitrospira sp.]